MPGGSACAGVELERRAPIEEFHGVDDMKGLAVRVQPSDVAVETIKAMGAGRWRCRATG